MQPMLTKPISRSSSLTSIESLDDAAANGSRRTRKRFTNVQLMMLENLFHHNSHPSRQERETLALAGNMEVKSVTIWFQNKRQMERKGALHSKTNRSSSRIISSAPYTSFSSSTSSLSARPSLDRVASRSELPLSAPRTPTRQRNPELPIWESMPSSPPAPMASPPAREFVEFGKLKRTRTLEWACARRRMIEKEGDSFVDDNDEPPSLPRSASCTSLNSSRKSRPRGKENKIRGTEHAGRASTARVGPDDDDDMMRAALTLCGLGRS